MTTEKKPRGRRKLETALQAHGKKIDMTNVTSLDQIYGFDNSSKYVTRDKSEYKEILAGMNLSDLHVQAAKAGLMPSHDRTQMINLLVREFEKEVGKYAPQEPLSVNKGGNTIEASKMTKEVRRILNEGA